MTVNQKAGTILFLVFCGIGLCVLSAILFPVASLYAFCITSAVAFVFLMFTLIKSLIEYHEQPAYFDMKKEALKPLKKPVSE